MIVNPVLIQEMRVRMRGGTAYLLLSAVILVFGGFTLATFWAITNVVRPVAAIAIAVTGVVSQSPPIDRILVAQRGVIFFLVMSLWAIVLTALIVPGATSGTIARERETRTLALLMGTPISSLSVILGKLLAAASYIVLVVAAGVPLFTLVVMFGGIPPNQFGSVAVIVLVTAFSFSALGVFISSISRNSLLASLISYTVVLVVTLGSYAVYLAASPLSKAVSMKYALYFSPLASIMSAMTQNNSQLNSIVSQFFREPGTRVAGEWWALGHYPLWYVTTAGYLIVGLLLVLAATRAINPLRRWI
ncbi:MAG TPA: ABC transporter permease [Chloroflexota bacterium]|nr:ABC transporter permease [Chloroflexota bacterium]